MAIYLKLGDVKGSATEENHKEWIPVDSFQVGSGRAISTPTGRAMERDASQPSISEVVITKVMDKASVSLFEKSCIQTKGDKAEFHFVRTGDPGEIYCTVELTNALVSGYSVSSGGDRPSESISINFTKIQWDYKGSKDSGDANSSFKFAYDLASGKKS